VAGPPDDPVPPAAPCVPRRAVPPRPARCRTGRVVPGAAVAMEGAGGPFGDLVADSCRETTGPEGGRFKIQTTVPPALTSVSSSSINPPSSTCRSGFPPRSSLLTTSSSGAAAETHQGTGLVHGGVPQVPTCVVAPQGLRGGKRCAGDVTPCTGASYRLVMLAQTARRRLPWRLQSGNVPAPASSGKIFPNGRKLALTIEFPGP
jgi:hypothetical protein